MKKISKAFEIPGLLRSGKAFGITKTMADVNRDQQDNFIIKGT
jgi:hypothetical protein